MQTAALGGNLHAGMHEMVEEYQANSVSTGRSGRKLPDLSCGHEPFSTSTIRSPASRARSST